MIDYDRLTNAIAGQFRRIDNNFIVCAEQEFLHKTDIDANKMYVVVSYGQASLNLNKCELPISITIVGLENEIDKTQAILDTYSVTYNNTALLDNFIQHYTTASVQENYLEIGRGFRSGYSIDGLLLVAEFVNISKIQFKYGDNESDYETIDLINYDDLCEASLNPQDYPNYYKTKSYGSFQTLAFSITAYPDSNSELFKKLLKWKWDNSVSHANDTFLIKPVINGVTLDFSIDYMEFKCSSFKYSKIIEEFPAYSVTFTL